MLLCYFVQGLVGLRVFNQHAGLFYLTQLLFKDYYTAVLKWVGN